MNFTFLFCSERSGSNLITRIMDSHSEICGPAPAHIFRIILNHRNRYGNLADPGNRSNLVADIIALMGTNLVIWQTSWTENELFQATKNFSLAETLRVIYEREVRAHSKKGLFIKENHNYRFINFLKGGFPGARFVVFVRDPRDMALSWKRSPNLRGCVIRAAKTWHEDQLNVLRLLGTQEGPPDLYLLRYEDLLTTPDSTLQRICDFLDISFEPKMLKFFETRTSNANARQSQDWENLQKPLMKNNLNKYRQALSPAEIQYVETICGEQMQELGYKREYPELPEVGVLRTLIEPEELWEKPTYADTPKAEQEMRARRFAVVQRIKQRSIIPRIS